MRSWTVGLLGWMREHLARSADGEHVMTLNRGMFCIVIATYTWIVEGRQSSFAPGFLVSGLVLTFVIFRHLLKHPGAHNRRRILAILVDVGAICLVMHRGDESTAVFFPLLLWVICGNGFRFGLQGLWASTTLGLLGFVAMAAATDFWRRNLSLTVGLMIGMIILPAYVSILIKKLYFAKARAEAANNAKTEFLTNVSHELRTPLQAIVGASNLLTRTGVDNEQLGLFRTIVEASDILLEMIGGLLSFSSIEQRTVKLDVTEFNVLELLSEVGSLTAALCNAKGLTVSTHMDVRTPLFVTADRSLIRDVLVNLSGNAVKYTSEGGVLLSVTSDECAKHNASLTFEVIDTGAGVSPEIQERVFDRFFTSASASNPGKGGLGIGLAVCKKLVQAMKGEIGLRGGYSQGAAFWFRVPVGLGTGAPCRAMAAKPGAALFMPNNIPKGRLVKMLSEQGRNVLYAGSPSRTFPEFLATARAEHRILLVATPRSDAAYNAMAKMLKEANASPSIPIVMVDELGQTVPAHDIRRLAPLWLRGNFTDDDMCRALDAVDVLASSAAPIERVRQPSTSTQLRILVVDDNKTSRTIFAKMVEGLGHLCDLAANGEQALDALEQGRFSLVLMDVNMPEVDGLEATRLQRVAELGMTHTPIVGMTADASPGLREQCRRAGMDDCVVKPVTTATLESLIAKFGASPSHSGEATSNIIRMRDLPEEPEVDDALITGLRGIGGREFVQDVLEDFSREVMSLVGDLSLALARADLADSRFLGHALASAASNIGALRVRRLGHEIEKASDQRLQAEGQEMAKQIRVAIVSFMNAMQRSLA